MKSILPWTALLGIALVLSCPAASGARTTSSPAFSAHTAQVNGVRIYYRIGGKGPAVVLLHGYAQTGHMWRPVMPELAKTHTVIVPDLRGAGASEKATTGYDKKTLAQDVHALVKSLGFDQASIVGHDIGMMAAYAYAAQFPSETTRVVLMDAFLPGIGDTSGIFLLRDKWHFNFYGETPLKLVAGRERIYLEHFWNDFAADPKHSVSERDRRIYAKAYAQPGAMRSGFEYFKAFDTDAADFKAFSGTKLTMPVLVIAGEKSGGDFLGNQVKLAASDVHTEVVQGSGHWLMDEARGKVIPLLVQFLQ